MAENRQQWGPATQIIQRVIEDQQKADLTTEIRCGNTMAMRIAAALHAAGHITRDEMWRDRQPGTPKPEPERVG